MANSVGTPARDIRIDIALVRGLLLEQFPNFSALAISPVDEGFDNVTYRLGNEMALRIPRREVGDRLIRNEQKWLGGIGARVPLPIPAPLYLGVPQGSYPWAWSIVPWFDGTTVDLEDPLGSEALVLAAFLKALHVAAPDNAPPNDVRGVPLRARQAFIEERMDRLEKASDVITPRVKAIWNEALEAPLDCALTWLHGDLHARNVLVREGRFSAVIDWGDMTAGDKATDLACLWMLLPDEKARAAVMEMLDDVSETTWKRAKGWAVSFGVMLVDTGRVDHPRHEVMGRKTLARVSNLDDF
jgi:aminoglycoside phosphotransferase (APT) family kinase protein